MTAKQQADNAMALVCFLIVFILLLAVYRYGRAMDTHRTFISECIINHSGLNPPQGIRSWCEDQYYAKGY